MLPIESMMVVVGAAAQAPASGAGFTVQLPSGGDTAESVPVFGSSNKTAKLLVELPRVRAQNEIPSYADPSRGPKLLYPASDPQSLLWDAWICSAVVLPQRARHIESVDRQKFVGALDRAIDGGVLERRVGGAAERAAEREDQRPRARQTRQLLPPPYHQNVPIKEKTLRSGLTGVTGGDPISTATPLP